MELKNVSFDNDQNRLNPQNPLEEVYPLSPGQKALWFLHQWAPESAAYNAGEAMRICSMIKIPGLLEASHTCSNGSSDLGR